RQPHVRGFGRLRRRRRRLDRLGYAASGEGLGTGPSHRRLARIPGVMRRRDFVRNGVSAAVAGVAFPRFLSDLARAQGASARNLVVLNLTGGNDGLSMVVPYTDPFYYSRRPTLAIPAGTVLQVGSDSSGKALGLHPR